MVLTLVAIAVTLVGARRPLTVPAAPRAGVVSTVPLGSHGRRRASGVELTNVRRAVATVTGTTLGGATAALVGPLRAVVVARATAAPVGGRRAPSARQRPDLVVRLGKPVRGRGVAPGEGAEMIATRIPERAVVAGSVEPAAGARATRGPDPDVGGMPSKRNADAA